MTIGEQRSTTGWQAGKGQWSREAGPIASRRVPLATRISAASLVVSIVGLLLALVAQTEQAVDAKLVYSGSLFSLGAVALVLLWYLPGPWSPAANPVLRAATSLVVGLGLGAVLLAWLVRIGPFAATQQPVVLTGTTALPLAAGRPVDLGSGRSIALLPEIETFGTSFAVRFVVTNRAGEPADVRLPDSAIAVLTAGGERFLPQRPDQAAAITVAPYADAAVAYTVAGSIPAGATHLDVSVASLTNPPIQWRLPLADVHSPGVVVAAHRARDSLRMFIVVSNYGREPIVARYRDGDVSLTDDRGNRYELLYGDSPRMFAVAPGRTLSDSTEFKGPLDPAARSLHLTIRRFTGAEDYRIDVPVR